MKKEQPPELFTKYINLLSEEKFEEALEVSRLLLNEEKTTVNYYYNHAMMAQTLGQKEETKGDYTKAKEYYQEAADAMTAAKSILPTCPVIRRLLSDSLFQLGRYREALTEKEYRFVPPTGDSPTPAAPMPVWIDLIARIRSSYPQPDWDKTTSLNGKTILIFNEAGHGDLIQNLRYLPILKEKGAKIIVEAKPELVKLIKNSPGVDEVVENIKADKVMSFFTSFNKKQIPCKTPDADYAMSCQSLAYYLNPDLDNIPMKFPYLFPENTINKAVELVKKTDKIKIGIVWAGNWKDHSDRFRSFSLGHFKHLSKIKEVQLFSLQKTSDLGKMERNWWQEKGPPKKVNLLEGKEEVDYIDLDDHLDNFNTTAEVIKNLDLVITVDTVIAHISGALDVPVWMLASKLHHDWRWGLKWYNSLTVFRQQEFMNWDKLLQKISEKLVYELANFGKIQ